MLAGIDTFPVRAFGDAFAKMALGTIPTRPFLWFEPNTHRAVSDGASLRDSLSVFFLPVGQGKAFEHALAGTGTALRDLALRPAGVSFAEFPGLSSGSAQS